MSVQHDITAESLRGAGFRTLHAGDDYNYEFIFLRSDNVTPEPLAGAMIWLTVKDDPIVTDANAKLQLSSASAAEIEVTDAPNGKILVKFVATGAKSTANLEGEWDYDIQIKLQSSKIITWASGKIEFLPDLTRAVT